MANAETATRAVSTEDTPEAQIRKVLLPRGAKAYPNAEQRARMAEALKLGSPVEIACLYAGIDIKVMRFWLEQGALARSGAMFELARMVNKGMGESAVVNIKQIDKAARRGDWRAAAWNLGKLFPTIYGDKMQLHHAGPDGGPVQVQVEQRTTVEIRATVEVKLGLPPGALALVGRQVAMLLTQQMRAKMAAEASGAGGGAVVDVVAEPV